MSVTDIWLEAAPCFAEFHNTQNPFLLFLLQTTMRSQAFYHCHCGHFLDTWQSNVIELLCQIASTDHNMEAGRQLVCYWVGKPD